MDASYSIAGTDGKGSRRCQIGKRKKKSTRGEGRTYFILKKKKKKKGIFRKEEDWKDCDWAGKKGEEFEEEEKERSMSCTWTAKARQKGMRLEAVSKRSSKQSGRRGKKGRSRQKGKKGKKRATFERGGITTAETTSYGNNEKGTTGRKKGGKRFVSWGERETPQKRPSKRRQMEGETPDSTQLEHERTAGRGWESETI